jgi:hypothetical protein
MTVLLVTLPILSVIGLFSVLAALLRLARRAHGSGLEVERARIEALNAAKRVPVLEEKLRLAESDAAHWKTCWDEKHAEWFAVCKQNDALQIAVVKEKARGDEYFDKLIPVAEELDRQRAKVKELEADIEKWQARANGGAKVAVDAEARVKELEAALAIERARIIPHGACDWASPNGRCARRARPWASGTRATGWSRRIRA